MLYRFLIKHLADGLILAFHPVKVQRPHPSAPCNATKSICPCLCHKNGCQTVLDVIFVHNLGSGIEHVLRLCLRHHLLHMAVGCGFNHFIAPWYWFPFHWKYPVQTTKFKKHEILTVPPRRGIAGFHRLRSGTWMIRVCRGHENHIKCPYILHVHRMGHPAMVVQSTQLRIQLRHRCLRHSR